MSGASRPNPLDSLETPGLRLERPTAADRDPLREMYADPEVMATLGGVRSAADADLALARMIAHWDAHDFGYWTLRDPENGRFAGRGGLRMLAVEGEPVVEVGYGLLADYWGRGLATEMAREAARVAFEELGLASLVCFTTRSNRASQRVMEKAGFRYERDFVHAELPHRLCRLSAEAWRAR